MKLKHVMILAAVLIVDQLSKFGIQASMSLGDSIPLIPGFFKITYLHNTGAAWSMLEGKMLFFYLISIAFLIGMAIFYKSTPSNDVLTRVGVVMMMAGTLGNFIDRLVFHYVRDFLDFIILGYDFPVFNVADMSLCIGVGLILLSIILENYGGFRKCAK